MTRPGLPGRVAAASAAHPFRTLTAWIVVLAATIALALAGFTAAPVQAFTFGEGDWTGSR